MPRDPNKPKKNDGANLGFETQLWAAADALRNNMDAVELPDVRAYHVLANPLFDEDDSRGIGPLRDGF